MYLAADFRVKRMLTIRQAQQTDQWLIRSLIYTELLNPVDLNWRRFLVAEVDGVRAGIIQVRQHEDGSRELASLVVKHMFRGHGVGAALIQTLLNRELGPLYLMCRSQLASYYSRFGFQALSEPDMPLHFRRMARLARSVEPLTRLIGEGNGLTIMRHPCTSAATQPNQPE